MNTMGIELETIQKVIENFLYGLSIPFRMINLLIPDGWEIAFWAVSIIVGSFIGVTAFIRKRNSY